MKLGKRRNIRSNNEGNVESLRHIDEVVPFDILKKLIPIRELSDEELCSFEQTLESYPADSVLFNQGDRDDSILYLIEGSVLVETQGKQSYQVEAGELKARFPLSYGKMHGATATTVSVVKVLRVKVGVLDIWNSSKFKNSDEMVLTDLEIPRELQNSQFFHTFCEAYQNNDLQLPSLPDVVIKLREAMKGDIGVAEANDIVRLDPAIVTRLVQVANSPLYSPITPVKSCLDAVNRLGLKATRSLVTAIGVKRLFKCEDPNLQNRMRALWKSSLYVSSISFVLASECRGVDADNALLAGLISDIGVIPLINFAESLPKEHFSMEEFEASIPALRGPVGKLTLNVLGFSEDLCEVPEIAEDWYYDQGDILDVNDIVVLAKLHSAIGTAKMSKLPYVNSIPAYRKLSDGELTPEYSLKILHSARQRIAESVSILSA